MKVQVYNNNGCFNVYVYPEVGFEFAGEIKYVPVKYGYAMTRIEWEQGTWKEFIETKGMIAEDIVFKAWKEIMNLNPNGQSIRLKEEV